MKIAIHDAETEHLKHKTFPNYALMKLSAWHKSQGDTVEWWSALNQYDRVYSSKVFDYTPENPYLPIDTIKGGTGYGLFDELPPEIDKMFPDYSIYPECDYAIGYITRGCPNNCPWCYVPRKEGNIKPYKVWSGLVRTDSEEFLPRCSEELKKELIEQAEFAKTAIKSLQEKQEHDKMKCEKCKYSRQSMIGSDLDCEFYIIRGISKRFTTKEKTDFCSYFEPKERET